MAIFMRIDDGMDHNSKKRKVIHFDQVGIDHLIRLGCVCNPAFGPALAEHIHRDSFELVFFRAGEQTYVVHQQPYVVHSREMFLSFPNEPHGTLAFKEEKSKFYYLIFYFPPTLQQFMGLSQASTAYLKQLLYAVKERVIPLDPALFEIFDLVINLYFSDAPMREEIIQSKATELFFLIAKCLEHPQKNDYSRSLCPQMQELIAFIEQNPTRQLSIKDLAEHVNFSVPRINQLFKEQVGVSPHDYILRYRVDLAKEMLQYTDCSVTDIAFQLGFSTSQHFSTTFYKYTMETPSAYRKLCRADQQSLPNQE